MRTLAFVTQKGGSGKSTLASSVAVYAAEQGERVCLVDIDARATLIDWAKVRGLDDIPVVASTPQKLPALLESLEKSKTTLAILDTPGAEGQATAAAMKAADLCIIPARPSVFDLWASATHAPRSRSTAAISSSFSTNVRPRSKARASPKGSRRSKTWARLLSPLVQARVDYQEAARHGWGVTELNANGAAAEEMRALWSSIKRRLNKAKTKTARKAA